MSSAPNVAAPAWSRLAFAAFLLALLGYGGYFAYYLIAGFDVVNLHRDALIDDAFYYFEIARNFAAGWLRASDLPAWQRQYGMAVYDFDCRQAGFVSAGRCAVGVQLPYYAISHVNIGTPGRRPHTWIF